MELYDKAIAQKSDYVLALFARENTRMQPEDVEGACSDWNKASKLGDKVSTDRYNRNCK